MNREFIESSSERVTESGCWIWMRSVAGTGYGDFRRRPKLIAAHRASYEVFKGPIPAGLHVLHSCDVRCCVNPAHLSVGSNAQNIADSMAKGRRKGVSRNRPSGLVYKKRVK